MTPDLWKALCGGMLMGAGAAVLLLLNGKIAGISGIAANAVRGMFGAQGWRIAFLLGLVIPAAIWGLGPIEFAQGLPLLAVAGFLVGFGTQLGSGCALALTMAGAIIVAAPAFFYVKRRRADLLGVLTELPDRFGIDRRLVAGSALFGVGWGISGICPGPGLLLLTAGTIQSIVFVGAMIAGFFAFRAWNMNAPLSRVSNGRGPR